jgi:hypothetical protein
MNNLAYSEGLALTPEIVKDDVPSLSTSGMMVEFSASQWGNNKKDKEASRQLAYNNNADPNSVTTTKKLIDHPSLDKLNKLVREIRREVVYAWTMPWSDGNLRYLPAPYHQPFTDKYAEYERMFWEYVDEFCEAYEFLCTQAEARLGYMWKMSDYPTVHEIRSRFNLRCNILPMPESGDFRLDIGEEQANVLKSKYQSFYESKLKQLANDMTKRVHDSVNNVVDTLTRYTDKKRSGEATKLSNSLIDNTLHLVRTMKGFNVYNDPDVESVRLAMEDALRGLTPDNLKASESARLDTINKFKAIKATLPSLDM